MAMWCAPWQCGVHHGNVVGVQPGRDSDGQMDRVTRSAVAPSSAESGTRARAATLRVMCGEGNGGGDRMDKAAVMLLDWIGAGSEIRSNPTRRQRLLPPGSPV